MRLALVTAAVVLVLPASALAMDKTQAVALANSVNLVSADLPGYAVTPPDSTGGGDSMARCAGSVPEEQMLVDIASANFEAGTRAKYRQVSSEVQVFPSDALAAKDFKAIRSKRARRCIVRKTKGQAISGVGRIVGVKLTLVKPHVPGAFGYRIALQVRHGLFGTISLVLDAFGVQEGPVVTSLASISGAKGELRPAQVDRLLGLLQTRTDAALNPAPSPAA